MKTRFSISHLNTLTRELKSFFFPSWNCFLSYNDILSTETSWHIYQIKFEMNSLLVSSKWYRGRALIIVERVWLDKNLPIAGWVINIFPCLPWKRNAVIFNDYICSKWNLSIFDVRPQRKHELIVTAKPFPNIFGMLYYILLFSIDVHLTPFYQFRLDDFCSV